MSDTFEALQHAGRQIKQRAKTAEQDVVSTAEIPKTSAAISIEQEMIDLYRHIEVLLPDCPGMVLQFIGSRSGEGVSTIVREYAALVTARFGKSVLILDANQRASDQQHFFKVTNVCGWDRAVCDPEAMDKAICCLGDSNLYLSGLSHRSTAVRHLFDASQLQKFFTSLKERFDLVLIDSPPVTSGTDSTVLSNCADGVLLVVEADKTPWPVAENMKTKIRNSGGNILGLIFNKRSYYIPEFLYRWL